MCTGAFVHVCVPVYLCTLTNTHMHTQTCTHTRTPALVKCAALGPCQCCTWLSRTTTLTNAHKHRHTYVHTCFSALHSSTFLPVLHLAATHGNAHRRAHTYTHIHTRTPALAHCTALGPCLCCTWLSRTTTLTNEHKHRHTYTHTCSSALRSSEYVTGGSPEPLDPSHSDKATPARP